MRGVGLCEGADGGSKPPPYVCEMRDQTRVGCVILSETEWSRRIRLLKKGERIATPVCGLVRNDMVVGTALRFGVLPHPALRATFPQGKA